MLASEMTYAGVQDLSWTKFVYPRNSLYYQFVYPRHPLYYT